MGFIIFIIHSFVYSKLLILFGKICLVSHILYINENSQH